MPRPTDREEAKAEAAWLRPFGDPTRFAILRALATGPETVKELGELCGRHQANVSTHLAVLRRVGLVAATPDGSRARQELVGAATARGLELVHASGIAVVIPLG